MKKRESKLVVFMNLFLFTLLACAPKIAPAVEPQRETIKQAAEMEEWQREWGKVLLGAQREKKVVIHIGAGISTTLRQEFSRLIRDKYGLEIEMFSGRVIEIAEKVIRERKAGLYLADLLISGIGPAIVPLKSAGVLEPLEPNLILPEVKDPKVWWEERLPFLDKDKTVFAFANYVSGGVTINTVVVKKDELQSYRELLQPRWKGKIAMNDPSMPGSGNMWFSAMGLRVLGMDYIRELARQDINISRDLRLLIEWVVREKYPVAIGIGGSAVDFIKAGAPIADHYPGEGAYLIAGWGNLALYNKAPHPNAARVFINWLLSKEGQLVYSKGMDVQSTRIDTPAAFLNSDIVRKPGVPYFNTMTEEFTLKRAEDLLIAKEIFNIR